MRKSTKSAQTTRVVKPEPAMSALEAEMSMLEDERYADGIDTGDSRYI